MKKKIKKLYPNIKKYSEIINTRYKVLKFLSSQKLLPITDFSVVGILNVVDIQNKNSVTKIDHLYNILSCEYTNDPISKFLIIDKGKYLSNFGDSVPLTIRQMKDYEVRGLRNIENQFPNIKGKKQGENLPYFHIPIPPVNIKTFFRETERNNITGRELVDFWLSDGRAIKSKELDTVLSSLVVPLNKNYNNRNTVQRWNNNSLIITNSQTGKSTTSDLMGLHSITGYITEAKLLGTYKDSTRTSMMPGALLGDGTLVLDEANMGEEGLMSKLLKYLAQGTSNRGIAGKVQCKGNKTMCIMGNPQDTERNLDERTLPLFVEAFLRPLLKGSNSEAVGSRFGIFISRHDMQRCKVLSERAVGNSSLLRTIYWNSFWKHQSLIRGIYKKFAGWIEEEPSEYVDKMKDISQKIPSSILSGIINGMSNSYYRTRQAVLRRLVLIYLPDLITGGIKNTYPLIENEIDNEFSYISGINLKTASGFTFQPKYERGTKEFFDEIKYFFPKNYGLQKLAKICGVTPPTISRWRDKDSKEVE